MTWEFRAMSKLARIPLFLLLITTLISPFTGGRIAFAQDGCDWSAMNAELTSVGESQRAEVFSTYSAACQEGFLDGLRLAPGEIVISETETPAKKSSQASALAASSCSTYSKSAVKKTALGFTAYRVNQNVYRCWDSSTGRIVGTPNHYVTFSSIAAWFQVQGQVSVSEYWYTYGWNFRFYEQWKVTNCIWDGCLGTFYPTSQGNAYSSGSIGSSVSGG